MNPFQFATKNLFPSAKLVVVFHGAPQRNFLINSIMKVHIFSRSRDQSACAR